MIICRNLWAGVARRCLGGLLLTALLLASGPARAIVDLDKDGISDVWALFYKSAAQNPTADPDGDGLTNAEEAAAGTDPFKPDSVIRVSRMVLNGTGLQVSFDTLTGKRYQLQFSPTLANPNWQNVGNRVAGTGKEVTVTTNPAGATERFYRVVVQDVDTDGDGVADWEELALGYDPNSSHTNGVNGPDDKASITQGLTAPNVVTAAAIVSEISESGGSPGSILITRTGNLDALVIRYTVSGSAVPGADYTPLSGQVTLPVGGKTASIAVMPVPDTAVESPETVTVSIVADPAYTLGIPSAATVLIADKAQANGNGVRARYWNNSSSTIPTFSNTVAPVSNVPRIDRVEPEINNVWGTASPGTGVNTDYFVSRYTADVLPEYSQVYTFEAQVERGGRLYVDGQLLINAWGNSPTAGTYSGTIELQAGRRYPIVFEHMARSGNATAVLRWESASQPKEVIPQSRLFATAPPLILSPLELLVIKGSPTVTYQIEASGEPTSFGAVNLPPGWSVDTATGLISGTPNRAGRWDIAITATNSSGSGSAILRLNVIETGGGLTREVWNGDVDLRPGATIPAPAQTSVVSSFEGARDTADNYTSRIHGFLTAPETGVYKFWITGASSAELWISNDGEAVNSFKRAEISSPTGYREWVNPAAGVSPLLLLEAGKRYYVEVRHKAGVGADHVSVGWLKPSDGGIDPESVASPSEVVPGYALSPFAAQGGTLDESSLYTTSMTSQNGAITSGYGSAMLRLSADESIAILSFNYANLSTPVSGKHIHSAAHGGLIIFDIDVAEPNADGSYTWTIEPVGPLSNEDILQVLKSGQAYLNIHTANYPAGEIRGDFRPQMASQTFIPPPPAPAWSNDSSNVNAAARFLIQTTFGVDGTDANNDHIPDSVQQVQTLGYSGWLENEFQKPPTSHFADVYINRNLTSPNGATYTGTNLFNSWWKNSITAPDQLRQRVAFALSQIMVVSENGPLDERGDALSDYYDTLLEHAFGNVRDLLEAVTLHPAMGRYLDMLRNDKPNRTTGRIPNENYAREILQLFSIGLYRMWPDGSLMLDSQGRPIPTYGQDEIIGFAHAFTGWDYNYPDTANPGGFRTSLGASSNWVDPMREVPSRHFTGQKRLLNNVVLPGLPVLNGQPLDPHATHSSSQYNDPIYRSLPARELDATHDQIFNHPNLAPFLCRQLIQRLVTSTPSRGYIYRVVQVFNDNGQGVRGDMKAVIRAILLDYEARSSDVLTQQGYGKQREPLLRVTALARAFPAPPPVVGTYSQVGNLITVTVPSQTFANGNGVFLDFSGGTAGDPDDTTYTVINPTTSGGNTTFTVRPLSTESTATYTQANATIDVAVTGGHTFSATFGNVANSVYLDFTSGTPSPVDGDFIVTSTTSDRVNFTVPAAAAKRATYAQAGNVITLTVPDGHAFTTGQTLRIDFVSSSSGTVVPGQFTVASVNGNQFTINYGTDAVARTGNAHVIRPADIVNASGSVVVSRSSYSVNRTGTVALSYSDWNVGSTDTELNQTPLRSPTVFNFYEPDYSFPGIIAQAGLVTPEFQITSDTSVMNQANFIFGGIFNSTSVSGGNVHSVNGLSSFKAGGRDIVMDFRKWLGNAPGSGLWTDDANLNALIDRINTLLLAGQLPSSGTNNLTATPRSIVNARQVIYDYVRSLPNSSTTNKRDRLRSVIHLIATSPDFTIQR